MKGEFQDQGQLDQELEEWLSPRGSQYVHGFFSEEEKQESIQTEDQAPEGARISNQAPEGETSTMVVVKLSEKQKGLEMIQIRPCAVDYTKKRRIQFLGQEQTQMPI